MAENGTLEILRKNGNGLDEIILRCATCEAALEYFAGGSMNFLMDIIRKHKCDPNRLARKATIEKLREQLYELEAQQKV